LKIDVPVLNEDGGVTYTTTLNAEQTQAILQFGVNFLIATGMAAAYGLDDEELDDSGPEQGELFN
jgi:hypothetical protein